MPKGMFARAAATPTPEKPKEGSNKREFHKIAGLEDYAILNALIDNLTTIRDTLRESVNVECWEEFKDKTHKTRPANFRGVEGNAEASIELRRRGIRSPLNVEEVEQFAFLKIPYGEVEVQKDIFYINPNHAENEKFIRLIEGLKGLPDDYILKQHGVKNYVVTDKSIDVVYEKGLMEKWLESVCVLAIKAKIENPDIEKALDLAREYVTGKKKDNRKLKKQLEDSLK